MDDYYRRTSKCLCYRCNRIFMLADVCKAMGRILCDDCYDKVYPKEPTMDIESKVADQAVFESKLEENRTLKELADDLLLMMNEQTQLILQLVQMIDPELEVNNAKIN